VSNRFDAAKPMQVGGQAVLEGVMMRGPGTVATAVRRTNGKIVVQKEHHVSLGERYPALKWPVLRGAIGLIEMMVVGMRTLNFSAQIAMEDLQETESGKNGKSNGNGSAHKTPSSFKDNLKLGLTVAFALAVGIALFFVTPLLIATFVFNVDQQAFLFNFVAGIVRVGLLLAYLFLISLSKEIKRLFQYHGAEHKAVFAFERGERLTVEAAARQSRFHPRCGTSFLLIVMVVSILLFSALDALLILWLGKLTIVTRLLTHIPLIPLVGGISYEFIKFSAKRSETTLGRVIVTPGLWLQKITTKEPDASQLEVAVVALRSALGEETVLDAPLDTLSLEAISVN
jgi:uncharacterized protein YqhQ